MNYFSINKEQTSRKIISFFFKSVESEFLDK